jgi:hypothetical protein
MLESQWADALVTRGEIRITTIDRCRSAEAGYGRSDSSENMLYPQLRSAMTRIIPEGHESEQIYRDWITKEGFRPVPEVPMSASFNAVISNLSDQGGIQFRRTIVTVENSSGYCDAWLT